MKTLRTKLFVSVGAILIISALCNILTSEIWIKNELSKAGTTLNDYIKSQDDATEDFLSFLFSFRLIEEAADLERVAEMTSSSQETSSSIWEDAARILVYDPNIAFIQVQSPSKQNALISPKDAVLHPFSWANGPGDILWIKLLEQENVLAAVPEIIHSKIVYFLYEKTHLENLLSSNTKLPEKLHLAASSSLQNAVFKEMDIPSSSYNKHDTSIHLFSSLLLKQNEWLEKMELIESLVPYQGKESPLSPIGALKMASLESIDPHPGKHPGVCILVEEAFSKEPVLLSIKDSELHKIPSLLLRNHGKAEDLDLVKSVFFADPSRNSIAIGFSLSSLLQNIATLIGKNIIVLGETLSIGFTPTGETFHPGEDDFPFVKAEGSPFISWGNKEYALSTIDLELFKLFVLTPKEESLSMSNFLDSLSQGISLKISLSLIVAGLLSLLIALGSLHRIAKRITGPIAILSKASEELSKGTYEDLILPIVDRREDEVATLAHSFHGMVSALRDRDKIRGVLNKVVSKEISQEILDHNIELGGEKKVITLLFSDIRNFTHFAEGMDPFALITILNTYMTRMCRIIDETKGVVDKFIGDEIMTLYGAPLAFSFHAVKAIEAALLMIQDLSSWNEEKSKVNEPTFTIGIGIHTGVVYTGNMGAENRLNYTAIGANVNEASRLCSVAKPMQILISEETFQSPGVQEQFHCQKLDPVHLKGIENPVQVYEVLGLKA